jgi:hypothetical protein
MPRCVFKLILWLTYYTNCNRMGAPHYVCADGSSDYSGNWMTYYTHHSRMTAPHYVCVEGSSDYPAYWMIHHIHQSNLATLHHVQVEVYSKHSGKWEEITWQILAGTEMSLNLQCSEMWVGGRGGDRHGTRPSVRVCAVCPSACTPLWEWINITLHLSPRGPYNLWCEPTSPRWKRIKGGL